MIEISILQRVLVSHFYKVNAGLFLFLFFVLFGLPYQPLSFHKAMLDGIVESQNLLFCVFGCWLLYAVKCADYIIKQVADPRQLFLHNLNVLSPPKRFALMGYVQVMVFMPVTIYAFFIMYFAEKAGKYLMVAEVIVVCLALVALPARLYVLNLSRGRLFMIRLPQPGASRLLKPLFAMPLLHLLINRKQMLLVTKVFTIGVLYLFISLYVPERHDLRPLLLCLMLVAAAHSTIIYQMHLFTTENLSFALGLPIHTFVRFIHQLVALLLLLLPELLFIWKGYGVHFVASDYLQLLLMLVAITEVFAIILLLDKYNMDQYTRVVFAVMAVLFFILLFYPGIILPLAMLGLLYALYASYCYNAQLQTE